GVGGVVVGWLGAGLLALNVLGRSGSTREAGPAPRGFGAPIAVAPTEVQVAPAAPAPPALEASPGQRLVVRAVEATWIRVQTDDGRVVEELLAAGVTREWTSGKRFVLTVGNAGGVELELNGQPLPSLGARGAVIHRLSLPVTAGDS